MTFTHNGNLVAVQSIYDQYNDYSVAYDVEAVVTGPTGEKSSVRFTSVDGDSLSHVTAGYASLMAYQARIQALRTK